MINFAFNWAILKYSGFLVAIAASENDFIINAFHEVIIFLSVSGGILVFLAANSFSLLKFKLVIKSGLHLYETSSWKLDLVNIDLPSKLPFSVTP